MDVKLSISLVIYKSDHKILQETISSLNQAVLLAKKQKKLEECVLTVVNNHIDKSETQFLKMLFEEGWHGKVDFCKPKKNIGYGAGHNLAINHRCEALHLVINPDVIVDNQAISKAIEYLENTPQVGLLTPSSQKANGQKEYLCKKYPSVLVLLLRGFAPKSIKTIFETQISGYELRELPEKENTNIEIASGCFMFFRGEVLQKTNGFSDKFFLYFEDFDLSIRVKQQWSIAYVPQVKIIHYGGNAADKGIKHIMSFVRSAACFYNQHGWKFF